MVVTRDALGIPVDARDALPWLPADDSGGLPDGEDSNADTPSEDGADEAATSDATAPDDPYADIPPDLLTQHRDEVTAEQETLWRQRVGEVHRIKNGELQGVNKVNVRLRAELAARDEYIRQHAQDWGLNEGDLAILTNKVRSAGDGAEAQYAAVTARYDQQAAWANERLEANLTDLFGAAQQRGYNPHSDPQFTALWDEAQAQMGQWVMAGEPEDGRLLKTQRAFDTVKTHLEAQKARMNGPAPATNGKRPTPPPSADQRARNQQRGPAAPARTGGTGRGMTEDRAWEQARTKFPDDHRAQFREALRLQEEPS